MFSKVHYVVYYILDNIYIRFGTKLYIQIVGITMDTNCASLVADLFLYCDGRDFMDSFKGDTSVVFLLTLCLESIFCAV